MNVLVIAPHPDDESIGCGGALRLHAMRGDHITVVYLTSGEWGLQNLPHLTPEEAWRIREDEARQACQLLGLKALHFLRFPDQNLSTCLDAAAERVAPILRQLTPGLLYLPHPEDSHPDHKATLPIIRRAIEETGVNGLTLLAYEIWSPMPVFTQVQDISPVMADKLRAVRLYQSQIAQIPYDRAIQGLNRYRGIITGRCRYAEVFQQLQL